MDLTDDLEHHPTYCLEDGNIQLIFQNKVLFRIYRGHLARHSQVFADMLSIGSAKPHPRTSGPGEGRPGKIILEDDQEYMDGVPVLRLDDSADDFAYLLDVVLEITPAKPTFRLLEGVLRISTKYLFDREYTFY